MRRNFFHHALILLLVLVIHFPGIVIAGSYAMEKAKRERLVEEARKERAAEEKQWAAEYQADLERASKERIARIQAEAQAKAKDKPVKVLILNP
jgi:hypothetical protein